MTRTEQNHWVIAFRCPDTRGIVHSLTGAIQDADGNITESQQYFSEDNGTFFIRVEFTTALSLAEIIDHIEPVASKYQAEYLIDTVGRKLRTLVLVSKAGHCLNDLLYRQRDNKLQIEIPRVLSNHADLAPLTEFYGIDFEHMRVTDDTSKRAFEERLLEIVETENIELVVLARYMQILSPEFCARLSGKIINIHHSFLPSFKGANPYAQAHDRGVKLIGATAHFVTNELDEGPIIEQNVERVNHKFTREQLISVGQDIESRTLANAVQWFAEHRVFLDGHRSVVFS
ncbi:MAG: formyltetrahydrofolate deformylase [Microbacteriaceae bacterium]|nr:formyltetrahydrofolate deformylase [Microbacteriaceae bacterium]